jgi:hypothetical protein
LKFCTQIVAASDVPPAAELDDEEQDDATTIPTTTSTGNLHAPRNDRNERTIEPPRPDAQTF